jgi:hypothetical protein
MGESIFETWTKLFTFTKDWKYRSITHLYFSNGGIDTINEGLFHNYLKIPGKDSDYHNRAKLLVTYIFNKGLFEL